MTRIIIIISFVIAIFLTGVATTYLYFRSELVDYKSELIEIQAENNRLNTQLTKIIIETLNTNESILKEYKGLEYKIDATQDEFIQRLLKNINK